MRGRGERGGKGKREQKERERRTEEKHIGVKLGRQRGDGVSGPETGDVTESLHGVEWLMKELLTMDLLELKALGDPYFPL